jgi:hypothetical protein
MVIAGIACYDVRFVEEGLALHEPVWKAEAFLYKVSS